MVLAVKSAIEAEQFSIESGFVRVSANYASGRSLVQANSANASMSTVWDGPSGVYNLQLTYYDENNGVSQSRIELNGRVLDSWSWNKNLGSPHAGDQTRTNRTIENVEIKTGDVIRVAGSPNGGEGFRIDRLDLLPPSSRGEGAPQQAFDSVEGFGAATTGGRGGHVVKVTNLNDSGVGSLRWALEDLDFARIVVFEVGGRINLNREIQVNGDVTVAGQTAPGGVTVSGARLQVVDDNVIIRGMKMRPGDGSGQDMTKRDGISVGTINKVVKNVVIDSNSMTWATDENFSIWGQVENVTVSNNLIAESLTRLGVGKGGIIGRSDGQNGKDISILKNLWVSNEYRNAHIKEQSNVEFANNLIYNYGASHQGLLLGGDDAPLSAAVIGNVYLRGPNTNNASQPAIDLRDLNAGSRVYLEGNHIEGHVGAGDNQRAAAHGRLEMLTNSQPFKGSGFEKLHANDVFDFVVNNAGARHYANGLDSIDQRIIDTVLNDSGKLIRTPGDVGGYLRNEGGQKLADTDGDGIPDVFERMIGSDPNRYDAHALSPHTGYSHIETYINGLIDGFDFLSAPTPAPQPQPQPTPQPAPEQPSNGGNAGAPPVSGPIGEVRTVGLEKFNLIEGFFTDANPHAENGALVRVADGASGRARMTFNDDDGVYALSLRYFDESDGISRSAVHVNGVKIDEWLWDRTGTSDVVTSRTITDRDLGVVSLSRGDVIEVSGVSDRLEPLRIDYLQFQEMLVA
jgi:hypothetical protein